MTFSDGSRYPKFFGRSSESYDRIRYDTIRYCYRLLRFQLVGTKVSG